MITDQVDVSLVLKASAAGTEQLVVDAKSSQAIPLVNLGLNFSDKTEVVGSRENTIKITFKNIYTAQLNKAGSVAAAKGGPGFGSSGDGTGSERKRPRGWRPLPSDPVVPFRSPGLSESRKPEAVTCGSYRDGPTVVAESFKAPANVLAAACATALNAIPKTAFIENRSVQ